MVEVIIVIIIGVLIYLGGLDYLKTIDRAHNVDIGKAIYFYPLDFFADGMEVVIELFKKMRWKRRRKKTDQEK